MGKIGGTDSGDKDHFGKIFFGYVHSTESIHKMSIWHNKVQTDYNNEYITQEGVAYSATMPKTARQHKPFISTLWEDAVAKATLWLWHLSKFS